MKKLAVNTDQCDRVQYLKMMFWSAALFITKGEARAGVMCVAVCHIMCRRRWDEGSSNYAHLPGYGEIPDKNTELQFVLYSLVKIHKPGKLMRPILDFTSSSSAYFKSTAG